MNGSVPLGVLDRSVPSGTHICTFSSGPARRDEVVMPFLAVADGMVHDNPYHIEPSEFLCGTG